MKFYAYAGRALVPDEPCGGDKLLVEFKLVRNALKHCAKVFKDKPFRLYTYTNFYNNETFTRIK